VNRALVLTNKYFGGKVPGYTQDQLTEEDKQLVKSIPEITAAIQNCLDHFKFRDAIKEAMNLARLGNKYLTDTEPWKVFKTDPQRVAVILNLCLQICANLSIAFEPFCPFSSKRLQVMLNLAPKKDDICPVSAPEGKIRWENLGSIDFLKEGDQIGTPELLFSKIEDETIQAQTDRLARIKKENEEKAALEAASHPQPQKPECTFEEFEKMDIRTATVLEAEAVPKTDKLLKLTIDTGIDQRVIVSGIAEYYKPEDMIGKQICILANLKPRKIRGIESNGMILMAKDNSGKMRFITPQEVMVNGATVG
ncbi:MAG: methionine--tRNA ligase subunit beta, partial [Bacteroidales bacterium]|nr:methionine--tRNA ligase subunit beta [Bacteroidales bacterium]